MSTLSPEVSGDSLFFDAQACADAGEKHHDQYVNAKPFPHIAIDEFLPADLLKRVVEEFPQREKGRFSDDHSNLKTGYQMDKIKSVFIRNLLLALNAGPTLAFLEKMTGIEGLIADPDYLGGGLHETARGGHLSIHADFNLQKRLKLIRRINLILFLNEDWKDEYGGELELWDQEMKAAEVKIPPVIGRAVVFNTDRFSYHGHPEPLTCPEDVYRRSMAFYYYTSPEEGLKSVKPYTTLFQQRPGTDDAPAKRFQIKDLAADLCPPILWRQLSKK